MKAHSLTQEQKALDVVQLSKTTFLTRVLQCLFWLISLSLSLSESCIDGVRAHLGILLEKVITITLRAVLK